ncbi:hypothetical protein L1887_59109 [Cichorium endivia]|nr:hypothetical protein L1887_59109 [Cichorium endivia]
MRRSSFAPRTELLSRTPGAAEPPRSAQRDPPNDSLFCAIDKSSIYSLLNSFHAALGSDRKCTSDYGLAAAMTTVRMDVGVGFALARKIKALLRNAGKPVWRLSSRSDLVRVL